MHAIRKLLQHPIKQTRNIGNFMGMSLCGKLKFDNKALEALPVDKSKNNDSRTVRGACFSLVKPTPVETPKLVAHSIAALELIGINNNDVENQDFAEYFSGNKLFSGSETAAHCYCGHQFGYFSGQLGDGAAIYLGEIINDNGERWELQLKGAGQTPYSRHNDGRKVLRSTIREFLCSEAMHHLGIPTTRAGTCVTSDSRVVRDMFYDGHPIMERCTIVSRIAPTFLRFGSFEIFKPEDSQTGRSGPSVGCTEILEKMLEYTVNTFFPEIAATYGENKQECYLEFYKEVVRRTARLVALWQSVGFCHGVLNTDNMSIMGITIDYGPFGFMDYFDADFICNASDNKGRYTYKKQPEICKWNLMKFAEGLKYVLPLDQMKEILNEIYDKEFSNHYYEIMRKKIGITKIDGVDDEEVIQKLLWTMHKTACDFTNTFLLLSTLQITEDDDCILIENLAAQCQDIEGLKKQANKNVNPELGMLIKLAQSHPSLIAQLGMNLEELKEMLEKSEKDKKILDMTSDQKKINDKETWADWIKTYRERLKIEIKDISETGLEQYNEERKKSMQMVNPKIVLRNHLAQEAIQFAEDGDFSKVQELLFLLENPYSNIESGPSETKESTCTISSAPSWAADLKVS